MRLDRRSIECGKAIIVLGAMALIAGMSRTVPTTANTSVTTEVVTREAVYAAGDTSANAGIDLSLEEDSENETAKADTSKKAAEEDADKSDNDKKDTNTQETEKTDDAWADRIMVNVDEYLNIRAKASQDSEIVGKLYEGSGADVIKKGKNWTKISSGSVKGYVKNEYIVFGDEAKSLAQKEGTYTATVTADALKIRSEASTDSTVLDLVAQGETFEVVSGRKKKFIKIDYNGQKAYIASEYADVELEVSEAVSIEEEQAALQAEEEAKAQEQAAVSTASSEQVVDAATYVSSGDTALLAALIWCEAGGESYEGQLAVGSVVMNRVYSGSFPGSISEVIYQSGQFTPAMNGKVSSVLASGSYSSSCYTAAQQAMAGVNNIGSALYFSAGISTSGITIGNQTFY